MLIEAVLAQTPNSGEGLKRLVYRVQQWDPAFAEYVTELQQSKPVVVTGDLNCAHHPIDIAHPKTNKKSPGFTEVRPMRGAQLYCTDWPPRRLAVPAHTRLVECRKRGTALERIWTTAGWWMPGGGSGRTMSATPTGTCGRASGQRTSAGGWTTSWSAHAHDTLSRPYFLLACQPAE